MRLKNRRPKKDILHVFLYFPTDLQRKPNPQFFKTEPAVFLKTEPNWTLKIYSAHP